MAVRSAALNSRKDRRKSRGIAIPNMADPAAMLGLIAAFGFIMSAIVFGGTPEAFIDLPSIFIVIGGTTAVTIMSFPLSALASLPITVARALSPAKQIAPSATAREALKLASDRRAQSKRTPDGAQYS